MSIATCMNCRKSSIGVCKVHNEDVNHDTVDYIMDALPIRCRSYEDRELVKWVDRCNHIIEEDHDG